MDEEEPKSPEEQLAPEEFGESYSMMLIRTRSVSPTA